VKRQLEGNSCRHYQTHALANQAPVPTSGRHHSAVQAKSSRQAAASSHQKLQLKVRE
jgi:hypothetical protein